MMIRIRQTESSQTAAGKGVGVLVERPPGGTVSRGDAVLYPGTEVVEIRSARDGGAAGLHLLLRGAARAALRGGALLLPPQGEILVSRWAVVLGVDLQGTAGLSRAPRPGQEDVAVGPVRVRLSPLGGSASRRRAADADDRSSPYVLEADAPLPLIPGRRYHFDDGRAALVCISGPRPRTLPPAELAARVREVDALDASAVERLYLHVYGVAPRLHAFGATAGSGDAYVFDHWIAAAETVREVGELLSDVLLQERELPVAVARELAESDRFFIPRTMWRPLLGVLEQQLGLERVEGVLRPRAGEFAGESAAVSAGESPSEPAGETGANAGHLSPAERAILETIAEAGAAGEHVKSERMTPARDIVRRLVESGRVVKLPNGRLFHRDVYRHLAEVRGEVDDRRAAELWSVSRNTAGQLIDRMIRDGLLLRTSPKTAVPPRHRGSAERRSRGGRR
jgi:hypothetical protein